MAHSSGGERALKAGYNYVQKTLVQIQLRHLWKDGRFPQFFILFYTSTTRTILLRTVRDRSVVFGTKMCQNVSLHGVDWCSVRNLLTSNPCSSAQFNLQSR